MGTNKKKRPKLNIAAGRPPTIQRPKSISRKATRTIISQIHTLEKNKIQAAQSGDRTTEAALSARISALGGIDKYQQASLQGQRNDRGGDSSRVLLDWLKPAGSSVQGAVKASTLRLLEVGALSTTNACSRSGYFDIQRIDLNSQGEGILQQDFMERPLPQDDSERFDIISLSLVLNFVPEPKGRGDMLLRTLKFLHNPSRIEDATLKQYFPSLFLVLPAPCVLNSRYLDEAKLNAIMVSLGYAKTKSKATQKLVYYLWTKTTDSPSAGTSFSKSEIRSGGSRNNFAIVLKSTTTG